jgi:hypothetical protein
MRQADARGWRLLGVDYAARHHRRAAARRANAILPQAIRDRRSPWERQIDSQLICEEAEDLTTLLFYGSQDSDNNLFPVQLTRMN